MLVSRAGLSPVMVGRDAELEQLRRLAANAATPTIALIGGEPGIGKTRLASELATAVAPGTSVLLAQADPAGVTHPFRLLRDLADLYGHADVTTGLTAGDPMARERAARELLSGLVSPGRTVLVLDDLHWADPETLAVFEQLDEVTGGPLLVVGTYRPEELSRRHPLSGMLERLDRRRGVTHLRLARLTPADTAGFLTAVYGSAPRRTVAVLHQRTGGNPFFLEELLKAAGDTDPDEIHTQPLPWNLAEALRSQLDGLPPDQRQVVEAAAVLGARVQFDLLTAVTGLTEPEMVAALRDLVDRGLLMEAEDDQFGFRHALAREAVTGEMLGRQRRRLHEAALAALRDAPAPDLAAVAVHARGAGRYAEMVDAACRGAGDLLAEGSAYGALGLAELALEEAPDDVDLLALAATAAWRTGYVTDARRHASHGLRSAADDEQRVAALTQLVRVTWEQGELAEMDEFTEQVRVLTETLPDGECRTLALAAVAQSYMLRASSSDRDTAETLAWAERACEAAERHGMKEVRLSALVEKGTALVWQAGTFEEGRRLLTEVAAQADHADAHLAAARGWHNLFWGLPPGDPAAREVLERVRASAERAGVTRMALGSYYQGLALLSLLDGDLDAAVAVLEQARRAGRRVAAGQDSGAPDGLQLSVSSGKHGAALLVELYLERGDLDAAQAVLDQAPAPRRRRATVVGLTFQLACRRGDLAAARRLLDELVALVEGGTRLLAMTVHGHVSAGLAAGLPVSALRRLADQDTGYHERVDSPGDLRRVLVAAQLAEAEGRPEEALAGYVQATDQGGSGHLCDPGDPAGEGIIGTGRCARLGEALTPGVRGTAAVGAARCLVQLGQPDRARAFLTTAQELLAGWPGWRRAELAAVARRLGLASAGGVGGTSRSASTGGNGAGGGQGEPGSGLTPREREVAGLVAEGLTNSEIARRLVISRKTVAVHVSHILAKLEMSSRTQIAAWRSRQPGG